MDEIFTQALSAVAARRAVGPLARIQHAIDEVRCECAVCGAHVYAVPGARRGRRCGNCGSFELQPLSGGR